MVCDTYGQGLKGNGLKCLFYHATWGNCRHFSQMMVHFNLNAHCISDGKESRI